MSEFVLFSQPSCNPCRAVKAALNKSGVPHRVIDIQQDERATEILRSGGYKGTPVMELPDGVFTANVTEMLTAIKQYGR